VAAGLDSIAGTVDNKTAVMGQSGTGGKPAACARRKFA